MIEERDTVMLWSKDDKHLCEVDGETKKISGVGIVNTEKFIGSEWGEKIDLGKEVYTLLKPSLKDIPDLFDRGAQIILPRIGGLIATYCDLSSGKKVIEGGAGSGAMTAVLSQMVRPEGKITTYELRDKSIKKAQNNLRKIGLDDVTTIKKGDITENIDEKDADLFFLDIPEPWEGLDTAEDSIKLGGFFASYVPTVNQLEKITSELKKRNYIDIKTFENLERDIVVREGAVRPSYDMLGHTGYIVISRKI